MESLQDILSRKNFTPPDESLAIKDYISRRYHVSCKVKVSHGDVTVTVTSSALAGSLHMEKPKIIDACRIKGKLFIRIGR